MKKLILQIADLLLMTEKSTEDWKNDNNLKNAWYLFVVAVMIPIVVAPAINLFSNELANSIALTKSTRILRVILSICIFLALAIMIYYYYKYILTSGNKMHFINIIYFYLISIIVFAKIYNGIFIINSDNFTYSTFLIESSDSYESLGWRTYKNYGKFIIYSSLESVPSSYHGISSNSMIVSIYNYIQNVFTIGLISLLIATFVRKNAK